MKGSGAGDSLGGLAAGFGALPELRGVLRDPTDSTNLSSMTRMPMLPC